MTEHEIISLMAAFLAGGGMSASQSVADAIELRAEAAKQLQAQHKSESAREQRPGERRVVDLGYLARRDEPRGLPRGTKNA